MGIGVAHTKCGPHVTTPEAIKKPTNPEHIFKNYHVKNPPPGSETGYLGVQDVRIWIFALLEMPKGLFV